MTLVAQVLNLVGVVFLAHAVYSAYEHSLLPSSSTLPPPSSVLPASLDPRVNLPVDITLETLLSVLLLCAGTVLSSANLKPIQWDVWAGEMERSKEVRQIREVDMGGAHNPYAGLEERAGFLDIRTKQKEFEAWAKENHLM